MNCKPLVAALAATLIAGTSLSASPLLGIWIELNGPGAARIAPCPQQAEGLCAFGLDRKPDGTLTGGSELVLVNVVTAGSNRWKGQYVDGDRKLPATLRMEGARVVTMRVCLLLLCQTARYERVG